MTQTAVLAFLTLALVIVVTLEEAIVARATSLESALAKVVLLVVEPL
jgi:hypothetical protein